MDKNDQKETSSNQQSATKSNSKTNIQFKITKQIKNTQNQEKPKQNETNQQIQQQQNSNKNNQNNTSNHDNASPKLDEILYPMKNDIDLRNRPTYQEIKSQNKNKNQSLGNYILNKTLGEGTFGKVKIATHKLTGEKVAIKILEKSKIQEVADVERVSREIHILKLLRHPSIVQLYEIIETSKQLFLVMEYAQNGELFEYIVKNKRVKENEACKFFQQILNGVQYIHQLKIVHRDLKPENLLLTEKNQIKIIDFGLSNTYKKGEQLLTACGSPCYAAPEMIAGKRYNGLEVDIWSCGVILHALVCGYLPFEDPNTSVLYQKILACEYKLPHFISDEVRDLIRKILNSDPKERYTINQIREHPWFKQNAETNQPSLGIIVGQNSIPIDQNILKQCQDLGCDMEYTQNSLEANKHNHVTTVYYLLLKKHILNGGESTSDINSLNFDKSQLILPKRKVVRSAYSYHAHNSLKVQQQQGIKTYNTTENSKLQELIDQIKKKNSAIKNNVNEQITQQNQNTQQNNNINNNQKLIKIRNYQKQDVNEQNSNINNQKPQPNLPQIQQKHLQQQQQQYRGRSQEVNYKPEVNYQSKKQAIQMYNSQSPSPQKKTYNLNNKLETLQTQQANIIQQQQQLQQQQQQIQQQQPIIYNNNININKQQQNQKQIYNNSKKRLSHGGILAYRQSQNNNQNNYYNNTNTLIHQTTNNSPNSKDNNNKLKTLNSKNVIYSEFNSRRPSLKKLSNNYNTEKKNTSERQQQLKNIQQEDITYKNLSDAKVYNSKNKYSNEKFPKKNLFTLKPQSHANTHTNKNNCNNNNNLIIYNQNKPINVNNNNHQAYLKNIDQNNNNNLNNNNIPKRIRAANMSLDTNTRKYNNSQLNKINIANNQQINKRERIQSLQINQQKQNQQYQQKLWINGLKQ